MLTKHSRRPGELRHKIKGTFNDKNKLQLNRFSHKTRRQSLWLTNEETAPAAEQLFLCRNEAQLLKPRGFFALATERRRWTDAREPAGESAGFTWERFPPRWASLRVTPEKAVAFPGRRGAPRRAAAPGPALPPPDTALSSGQRQ